LDCFNKECPQGYRCIITGYNSSECRPYNPFTPQAGDVWPPANYQLEPVNFLQERAAIDRAKQQLLYNQQHPVYTNVTIEQPHTSFVNYEIPKYYFDDSGYQSREPRPTIFTMKNGIILTAALGVIVIMYFMMKKNKGGSREKSGLYTE